LRCGIIFMREPPASVRQQAGGDAQTEPSCTA
jgi:hypothetical protein